MKPLIRIALAGSLLAVLTLVGCGGAAWKAAQREDSAAGYYRFLREHADSKYAVSAREHLDFLKLRRDLSLQQFEIFLEKYPDSQLADALRPRLEPEAFDIARGMGTPAAYQRFIDQFPNGELRARAEGNAAYLEAAGFAGHPDHLARFADEHPESDFAAEARRSSDSVALRGRTRFQRVGLKIELSPSTPDQRQLRTRFTQRAQQIYGAYGIELVMLPDIVDVNTHTNLPPARLTIKHHEKEMMAGMVEGEMSRPGMLAITNVTLATKAGEELIFEQTFTQRVEARLHVPGTSVLQSASSRVYWDAFFVPVATWPTRASVRDAVPLEPKAVDVDSVGDRSVVLYEDGHFQLIELADPQTPHILAGYTRPDDMKHWSSVRILGDRVALFGEEGLELVRFGPAGPERVITLDRSKIGTVFAIEQIEDRYLLAGARGLILMDPETGELERVMRRVIKSVAVAGSALIFTDGESVYVSNLALLAQDRVSGRLKLGKTFAPRHIRAFDGRVLVIGEGGVLVLDHSAGGTPKVAAKLLANEVGHVTDATAVGTRIFLLSDRGLLIMDPSGTRLTESINVASLDRVSSMGRHVVGIGPTQLQVVDATPFLSLRAPASAGEAKPR